MMEKKRKAAPSCEEGENKNQVRRRTHIRKEPVIKKKQNEGKGGVPTRATQAEGKQSGSTKDRGIKKKKKQGTKKGKQSLKVIRETKTKNSEGKIKQMTTFRKTKSRGGVEMTQSKKGWEG